MKILYVEYWRGGIQSAKVLRAKIVSVYIGKMPVRCEQQSLKNEKGWQEYKDNISKRDSKGIIW